MIPIREPEAHADYMVLNNGGKIVRMRDGAVLRNIRVGEADAKRLIEFCLSRDYPLHVLDGMYWGVNRLTAGTRAYAEKLGVSPVVYRLLEQTPYRTVEGFTATVENGLVTAFIDAERLTLEHVQSEPGCVDIMHKGVTKWREICALCDLIGIACRDVIAAGNYTNDIDFLRGAGVGVAVSNALDAVKEQADYITRADNNHEAVAEIICSWGCESPGRGSVPFLGGRIQAISRSRSAWNAAERQRKSAFPTSCGNALSFDLRKRTLFRPAETHSLSTAAPGEGGPVSNRTGGNSGGSPSDDS